VLTAHTRLITPAINEARGFEKVTEGLPACGSILERHGGDCAWA